MKKKQFAASLLAGLMLAGCLAGCTSAPASESSAEPAADSTPASTASESAAEAEPAAEGDTIKIGVLTYMSSARAATSARRTFSALPEVDMPSSTSPGRP